MQALPSCVIKKKWGPVNGMCWSGEIATIYFLIVRTDLETTTRFFLKSIGGPEKGRYIVLVVCLFTFNLRIRTRYVLVSSGRTQHPWL